MTIQQLPSACIWCRGPLTDSDMSHVLPECVGNERQQVLPMGVVCKKCNQYFGAKVEPALLDDPIFHTIAVALRLVDPSDGNAFRDKIFDNRHQPISPPQRTINLHAQISSTQIDLDIRYEVAGRLSRSYLPRDLAFISRAVHKIAFESLAWTLYVKGLDRLVDLLDTAFDHVRKWAREGQPRGTVRAVARKPGQTLSEQFETQLWEFEPDCLAVELNPFGDWYAVSLTSPPNRVVQELRTWTRRTEPKAWILTDTLSPA